MKNFLKTFIAVAAIAVSGTYAKWGSCGLTDYNIAMKGFSQGFQKNSYSQTTDCFDQTVITMNSMTSFFSSFYYYTQSDFLAPLYKWADLGIEITNLMSSCTMVNFAKQLGIRSASLGGLFELVAVVLMSFARNAQAKGESELYNAFKISFVNSDSCVRTSRAWGEMLRYMVSYETPSKVYYEELVFSLSNLDE